MAEQFVAASPVMSNDFSVQCQHLMSTFKKRGMPLPDMRHEGMIELQISGGNSQAHSGTLAGSIDIRRIEGPIRAIPVPRPSTSTRLRYFLDGAQKTLPMFNLGRFPVFASLSSAAILERSAAGDVKLAPDTLRLSHSWIIPEFADDPRIADICTALRTLGGVIIDPVASPGISKDEYARLADDYLLMQEKAAQVTRIERQKLERNLLASWGRNNAQSDDWIVVDGPLVSSVRNAVGLVKSFTYQYVTGYEATNLYSLESGHRTSAFSAANAWRNTRGAPDEIEISPTDERVLWYMRFWDASGHDARHSLVRIETAPDFIDAARIDELSSWLLAERAPRSTADARWDTLLYPIHLLEKMLKRRIDTATRSWPGARQR